jgi:putative ABC transport system permease protein
LYPLPVRLAGWFGSLRRGAVIFVGFRRIVQQPLAARLPLVVMLMATGIAVFAAVVLYSITEGQQNSTWQEVGADFRIESVREDAPISSLVDLSVVEGIEATADAARFQGRDVSTTAARGTFTLLAIDPAEYQEVVAGTRADPRFPESMLVDQSIQGIGTEANPLPAIVSSRWNTSNPPSIGDTINVELRRITFTIVVRGIRETFPSLAPGDQFVVLPRASLEAVDPTIDTRGAFRYVKAPASIDEDLRATLRSQSPSTQLVSRPQLFEDLAESPLVDGVENAFRATVILATLYAVLAALAGIALTARERARDLGYLRTLGLTSRQATILTVIEQLPPAILATVAGAGLGFVLVWLVEPGLDLSTFAGATLPTDVLLDARVLALVTGAQLVTILVAIAIYSYLTRRMNLGNVLRLGDRT